jgi:hypothetical protein
MRKGRSGLRSEHTFPKFDDILELHGNCAEPSNTGVTVVGICDNALDINLFSSYFAFRPPIFAGGYLARCSIIIILHSHWRNFDGDRSELTSLCITTCIWNKRLDTFA